MKIRFKTENDELKEVARVYSEEEHGIDFSKIDKDAVHVIEKLLDNGFETYLVGGAVRDLYLGTIPKDFDVVTQASPRQVRRVFQNSRVIGRRFKIVHVTFGKKIIEVSTFRSLENRNLSNDNVFGTIEEDAKRRDFSVNSLYYDISDHSLIDFNDSLSDFRKKRISSIIPLSTTFQEDPVRMIRAVKCSVMTGFKLKRNLRYAIRRDAPLLSRVSTSRLTEELNKILASGYSCRIFKELDNYKLLVYLLPCISVYAHFPQASESLLKLDEKVRDYKNKREGAEEIEYYQMFYYLTSPLVIFNTEFTSPTEIYKDIFRQIKVLIAPNTPPNFELEKAARMIMAENGIKPPKQYSRKGKDSVIKERNRVNYSKRVSSEKS